MNLYILDHCLYFLVGTTFDSLASISFDFCQQCKTGSCAVVVGVRVSLSLFLGVWVSAAFCVHMFGCVWGSVSGCVYVCAWLQDISL